MKKNIFKSILFLFILLSVANLSAQTSQIYEMQLPYPVSRTIVREAAAPISIVYAETSQGHYFIHNDHSGTQKMVEINSSFSVSDFDVDGDSVFFCGNIINGQVFLGFFDINDLFFGSGAYSADITAINTLTGTVDSLSKMVTYKDSSFRQIAAIGTSSSGLPCVVHIYFTVPAINCIIDVKGLPAAYDENLLDINLTDNHIITAGFAAQSSAQPYLIQPSQISIVGESKEDPLGQNKQNQHNLKTFFVKSVDETKVTTLCQQ